MALDPALAEGVEAFLSGPYRRVVAAVQLTTRRREDAEDAVHEALARLVSRGSSPDRWDAWVFVTARNVARRRWLRSSREVLVGMPLQERAYHDPDPLANDALHRAIARLPRRQQETTVMHYLLDMSIEDIASATGISAGAVKNSLFVARGKLRAVLSKEVL